MHGSQYRLAIHNGNICIAATTSDFNEPVLREHFYPTTISAYSFCTFFFGMEHNDERAADKLATVSVRQVFPGTYDYTVPGYNRREVTLPNGSRELPVKNETREYPKPRTKCQTEYRDGHWHKCLKSGWVRV